MWAEKHPGALKDNDAVSCALRKGNYQGALAFGLAVVVGLTPQMLPMIVTTNLARGAALLRAARTVVRRLDAVQSLGAMCAPAHMARVGRHRLRHRELHVAVCMVLCFRAAASALQRCVTCPPCRGRSPCGRADQHRQSWVVGSVLRPLLLVPCHSRVHPRVVCECGAFVKTDTCFSCVPAHGCSYSPGLIKTFHQ